MDHYKKALLEQVALKQFELMSDLGGEVARTAKDSLRQIPPQVSEEVTLWHRTYHQFRIAVNYFVLGVEKYTENLAEDALELLTISYVVNDRIMEDPPPGVYKVCLYFIDKLASSASYCINVSDLYMHYCRG